MASPRRFLFVLGSARTGGNTEALARAAAECLSETDRQEWIHLDELALPPFTDRRHTGDGTAPPASGAEKRAQDATLAATDIIIASPLYWYSVSGTVKTYLDYWSGWMRVPGLEFRPRMVGKRLWGVSAVSDPNPAAAEPMAGMLRLSAEYLRMEWRGLLLGNGSRPGDVLGDHEALAEAKTFLELDAPGS
ncbi:NAD(P)H-dependent oxidoreductase [Glycomyces albus]